MNLGKINVLTIERSTEYGLYLVDKQGTEVLLPTRYVTDHMTIGQKIEVFVYKDSDDLPVATTETPLAQVGEFSFLKVIETKDIGAFLDWGLSKDLFVPYGEQLHEMQPNRSYVVFLYIDNTGRIAGSSKLDKFLNRQPPDFKIGQQVELLICEPTDLGFNAIVDGKTWGLLYNNEIFQHLNRGQRIAGYIKKVREDGKFDVCLKKPSFDRNQPLQDKILAHLEANNGESPFTDKCDPTEIYQIFEVSKSQYKQALGMLYRQKKIRIEKDTVFLATVVSDNKMK